MRTPDDTDPPSVSRRNLFGGIALAVLMPQPLSAAQVEAKLATLDPKALHSLLRGLVFLDLFGDPVLDDDAAALLQQIEVRLPGASDCSRSIAAIWPRVCRRCIAPRKPQRSRFCTARWLKRSRWRSTTLICRVSLHSAAFCRLRWFIRRTVSNFSPGARCAAIIANSS